MRILIPGDYVSARRRYISPQGKTTSERRNKQTQSRDQHTTALHPTVYIFLPFSTAHMILVVFLLHVCFNVHYPSINASTKKKSLNCRKFKQMSFLKVIFDRSFKNFQKYFPTCVYQDFKMR